MSDSAVHAGVVVGARSLTVIVDPVNDRPFLHAGVQLRLDAGSDAVEGGELRVVHGTRADLGRIDA